MSKININNNNGDIIGVNISGAGNIIGKNISITGNINISQQEMSNIPQQYSKSINDLVDMLNQKLSEKNIEEEKVKAIETQIKQLLKELKGVDEKKVDEKKKDKIRTFFENTLDVILKIIPDSAEIISSFTPLAPFSKLIGKSAGEIVKKIQNKG